jgi:hypothetical protein
VRTPFPFVSIPLVSTVLLFGCSAHFELKPPPQRAPEASAAPRYSQHIDQTVYGGDAALPAAAGAAPDEPVLATNRGRATATATATAPATLPASDLNLIDAPPIDAVIRARGAEQVEFVRTLQPVSGPAIYFGHVLASDPRRKAPRTSPVIATRDHNRWKAVEVADARAVDASWAYIGAGPERGHAWGVLEPPPTRDGSAAHLLLVHSADSGATWRTIPLIKPSSTGRYDSIAMSRYRGRVTVYQPPGASGARPGFYHYQTTDLGATWDTPTFEPDALAPADPVSDEDRQRLRRGPSRAADAK